MSLEFRQMRHVIAVADHGRYPLPFWVPFRCLYSRNVHNLFMAGRNISVTHVAGSSTKTMLNGGQTGVATGVIAFLCRKYQTNPRGVYQQHLAELQKILGDRG